MSVLDSLPDRPLTDAELASFNRSDALEVAVDVADVETPESDEVVGLLLATDDWVKGLAYDVEEGTSSASGTPAEDRWRVVETVSLGGGENERFQGMQACESAVRAALD